MFLTYLCLVLSTMQILTDNVPKPVPRYTKYLYPVIHPSNLVIPQNSHFDGILSATEQSDQLPRAWMYDWIEYKRNISKDSSMELNYIIELKVQYKKKPFWDLWDSLVGTVPIWIDYEVVNNSLCSEAIDTVGGLVQQLLGVMPQGCPVSVGEKRDTSGIHFPLRMESISFSGQIPNRQIRILFSVKDVNTSELLFTGIFHLEDPFDKMIEYHGNYTKTSD